MDHCRKFARIFDEDGDGQISLEGRMSPLCVLWRLPHSFIPRSSEFEQMMRFCIIIASMEGTQTLEEEDSAEQTLAMAKMEVDDIISMVADDVSQIAEIEKSASPAVKDFLASDEFWLDVIDRYKALDIDGNGHVTSDELFPIIIELTNSQPWAVTDAHCARFASIFDTDGDGLISCSEFEALIRFCVLMSSIE